MSAYAASHSGRLQAAEHPHRARPASSSSCSTTAPALPLPGRDAMREGDSPSPTSGSTARRGDHRRAAGDARHGQGGEIASGSRASTSSAPSTCSRRGSSATPRRSRRSSGLPLRAARRLGADRRRLMDRLGRHPRRSPNAERQLGRRGPLGRARRLDRGARRAAPPRSARRPPAPASSLEALAVVQRRARSTTLSTRARETMRELAGLQHAAAVRSPATPPPRPRARAQLGETTAGLKIARRPSRSTDGCPTDRGS